MFLHSDRIWTISLNREGSFSVSLPLLLTIHVHVLLYCMQVHPTASFRATQMQMAPHVSVDRTELRHVWCVL